MAIVFVEGFDMYNGLTNTATAGGITSRWDYFANLSLLAGRFGGQAAAIAYGTSSKYLAASLGASYTQGALGFAFYASALPSNNIDIAYVGTTASLAQLSVVFTVGGGLAVYRGILGTGTSALLGATALNIIPVGAYSYIELEFVIDNSVGSAILYLSGTPVLTLSGVDTQNLTDNTFSLLSFGTPGGLGYGFVGRFDDVYLTDTPSRLGEQRVFTANVDADASPSDWAASGGAVAPYTMIDEVLCDGDTTYISSSTLNARAMFGVGNLPVSPTGIQAVQISSFGRKTDTGLRKIQLQYEDASANLYTSSEYTLAGGPGYGRQIDLLQNNPITTAGWTASEVNAMKIGVKVST